MIVRRLEATDFRNFTDVAIELHPKRNVFFGANGQGKTNLLEALYLLGALKSFRARRTKDLLRFGSQTARVVGEAERGGLRARLEVALSKEGREVRVDGKARSLVDYFGRVSVVVFAPEHVGLVPGPPGDRRKFLDRLIFNLQLGHAQLVIDYQRAVRQRNSVLQKAQAQVDELLDAYDMEVARLGASIILARQQAIKALHSHVVSTWERVGGHGTHVNLRYQASSEAAELGLALAHSRPRDLARRVTHVGPHLDDLIIELDGRRASLHASQGQMRALVLALKLAEIEQIREKWSEPPLLLLDDVSSELDKARAEALFSIIREQEGQVVITTTQPSNLPKATECEYFQVVDGRVKALESLAEA